MLTLSLSDPIIQSILVIIGVPVVLILTSLYYKLIRKILIKFFNMSTLPGYDMDDTNITAIMISVFTILFVVLFIIFRK